MSERFHSFVVFAEMRTGSNFLESNLNALEGVTCHGEAFNPHFIGSPDKADLLGMSQAQRDRNPALLLDMIEQQPGIGGFRYFHDHDPRILDRVLADPRCAKIILTRDPVESYVSWKIACSTGQWKLTDIKSRRVAKAHFDAIEFADYMDCLDAFRQNVMRRLHVSGQTAFCLTYEDLQSIEMPNGVACYLGLRDRLDRLDRNLKVQNPEPLSDKVSNLSEMGAALSGPQ